MSEVKPEDREWTTAKDYHMHRNRVRYEPKAGLRVWHPVDHIDRGYGPLPNLDIDTWLPDSPQLPAVAERLAADPDAVAVVRCRSDWEHICRALDGWVMPGGRSALADAIRAQLGEAGS